MNRSGRVVMLWAAAIAIALLSYDPAAHAASVKRCALALVALAFAAWSTARTRPSASQAPPAALSTWLNLGALAAISLLWSHHPRWQDAALWLTAGCLALCTYRLPINLHRKFIQRIALITLLVAALVTYGQWLLGRRGVALHGLFGNPNWLGITLACTLPHALAAVGADAKRRYLWLVLLAVVLPALLLAGSGTALVALAVAAALSLRRRMRIVAMVVGTGLLAAGWWLGPLARSWSGRLWIWRHAAHAGLDSPLLGSGLGSFAAAFLEAQGQALQHTGVEQASRLFVNATSAHNDWLQLWIELGALGPLLLASALLLAWWRCDRKDIASRATLIVIALSACGDMALRLPAAGVMLALTLSLARTAPPQHHPEAQSPDRTEPDAPLSPRTESPSATSTPHTLRATAAALLPLAILAITTALTTRRWLAERHVHTAAVRATPDERIAALSRAHQLDPSYPDAQLLLGTALLQLGHSEPAREHLQGSLLRLPNAGTHLAIGNAWLRDEQPDRAIGSYRRALELQPGSFRAHLNLAAAHQRAEQLDRAEHHYALARELLPHHPKLRRLRQQLDRSAAAALP